MKKYTLIFTQEGEKIDVKSKADGFSWGEIIGILEWKKWTLCDRLPSKYNRISSSVRGLWMDTPKVTAKEGAMSSTALEVMKAIVENGGPIEGWTRDNNTQYWVCRNITGVDLRSKDAPIWADGYKWSQYSLTNPNKTHKPLGPWVNDWAKFRAVDSDGRLFEYRERPGKNNVVWTGSSVTFQHISTGHDHTNWENSLEERPKDEREVCPNCGEKAWKIAIEKGMPGCSLCKKPWHVPITEPKTRPMTPREFAKFVGENLGNYLYRDVGWNREYWELYVNVASFTEVHRYRYAHNLPGELVWRELPEVEE